jgi:hypothetical protein
MARIPPIHLPPPLLSALRPDDLLALHFTWLGMNLKDGKLQRDPNTRAAFLIVDFEPQHIADRAYFMPNPGYDDPSTTPPPPEAPQDGEDRARISGRSRLVFAVPADIGQLPCEAAALLAACSRFPLRLVERAVPPPPPGQRAAQVAPPTVNDPPIWPVPTDMTAIEAPWRLALSPSAFGSWLHATEPVRSSLDNDRVELWHTRLGAWHALLGVGKAPDTPQVGERQHDGRYLYERGSDGQGNELWSVTEVADLPVDHYRTVRAIASPDRFGTPPGPPAHANTPFRMSLDARDRHNLVGLTSDFSLGGAEARVVHARRLMLSALGAWLDLDYGSDRPKEGDGPKELEILAWRHLAALGRDEYVRVVYDGALYGYPFGSTLVKVTERTFEGGRAIPRQFMFLVTRRWELTFPKDWRALPFRRVRMTKHVTPLLNDPMDDVCAVRDKNGKTLGQTAFWPCVAGVPYRFPLHFEDWEGKPSDLDVPLIFVSSDGLGRAEVMEAVKADYLRADAERTARRTTSAHGQRVAFAETDAGSRGKTTLVATEVEFGVEPALEDPLPMPPGWHYSYAPTMKFAKVRVPAVERLVGAGDPIAIELDRDYVTTPNLLTTSVGKVFARVPSGAQLKFRADRSGGIVTPNLSIGGLSRDHGPVGGGQNAVGAFANGTFTASDFFAGADAKILGGIDLFEIIADVFADGTVPKLTSVPVYPGDDPKNAPTQVKTELDWSPQLQGKTPFEPDPGASMTVKATVLTDLASGESSSEIHGTIASFRLNLFGFVILPFNSVHFVIKPGEKTHFSADMKKVEFGGPLEFVNELDRYMSGFLDPPSLAVTDEGVQLGYSLELPELAVGVLTIQNVALGAALNLPFTGDPVRFRFAFCERERPFGLLVYVFGGGGFFAIALGADGVEQIEASLEFGAAIEIDIGVASGGVHVMAGIYFSWQEPQNRAWLEGYVRMGGEFDVLGLVSLSLEFVMSLAYASGNGSNGEVWGEATLVVEVSVACFSDSVEMSVRREFGDPERPLFSKMVTETEWNDYWSSFGPLAA